MGYVRVYSRSILIMMATEDQPAKSVLPRAAQPPSSVHIACPDCGLMQRLTPPARWQVAECGCCRRILAGEAAGRTATPLAFALAALVLLLPALLSPLMSVSSFGARREAWLPSSAAAIWRDGFPSLGVLVGLFSMAIPVVFLLLLIWVLGNLQFGAHAHLGTAFRWVKHLRPWVMIEVYLVGCFVAYSRLKVVAVVDVGTGGWCLIAAALAVLIALILLDERTIWERLRPQHTAAADAARIGCTVCDLIVSAAAALRNCPRCHARLHSRKPHSLQRTAALVAAGYVLYIPANALPVLTTIRFGRAEHNTILSGVLELIRNDLWPLAIIVFSASIVLPLVKLCGLTWMLLATQLGTGRHLIARTRLYRSIDAVGRWSNIDVFAVSILLAVLQFGELTAVHTDNGLLAFAAVVILTMFASRLFDPRLMWDAAESRDG